MSKKGFTPGIFPEEEAIMWGDDGGNGLTPVQYKLFGLLRRSMDRNTGIAGSRSRISYGGLYERMYQEAGQGFAGTGQEWGATREQRMAFIRGQVRILEKTGLIKRLSQGKQLVIEFLIFNQMRGVYFSNQNVSSGFAPGVSSGFAPKEGCNKNSDLPENKADSKPVYSGSKSGVCSTYPKVSKDKDASSKHSSNLIESSNSHANLLTSLQTSYWDAIQQTRQFSLPVLTRPDRQVAYQRMLARWESEKVNLKQLPAMLKTILDEQSARGNKTHSPLYFEEPVLRLAGESNGKAMLAKRHPAKAGSTGIRHIMERYGSQAHGADVQDDSVIVVNPRIGISGPVESGYGRPDGGS